MAFSWSKTRHCVGNRCYFLLILVALVGSGQSKCDVKKCSQIPGCRCPGADIPGGLDVSEVPQMVFLTFQGHVDKDFWDVFSQLFPTDKDSRRDNPNGCPVTGTVFVSNERTRYCIVNRIWSQGHEVANHGLARRTQEWWRTSKEEKFAEEVQGQEKNLAEKAEIELAQISGWRSPFFQSGGDELFRVLHELQVEYDSSLLAGSVADDSPQLWPFTLDFPLGNVIPCNMWPCPEKEYPGLWEVPVLKMRGGKGQPCQSLEACAPGDSTETYDLLRTNMERLYKSNRAPMMVNLNAHWLSQNEAVMEGLQKFIKFVSENDDIWVLPIEKGLQWMRDPTPLGQLDRFYPWKCDSRKYVSCDAIGDSDGGTSESSTDDDDDDKDKENVKTFLIKNGNNLVIWQYVVLAVSLVVVIRYDRATAKK